jgi:hypothetical protein
MRAGGFVLRCAVSFSEAPEPAARARIGGSEAERLAIDINFHREEGPLGARTLRNHRDRHGRPAVSANRGRRCRLARRVRCARPRSLPEEKSIAELRRPAHAPSPRPFSRRRADNPAHRWGYSAENLATPAVTGKRAGMLKRFEKSQKEKMDAIEVATFRPLPPQALKKRPSTHDRHQCLSRRGCRARRKPLPESPRHRP